MWFVKRSKLVALLILSTAASVSLLFNNCAKGPSSEDQASTDPNDVGANFSGQLISNISYVSNSGQVYGYAYDPQNKSNSIKVIFYVDGPVGTGQYVGEVSANIQSVGPNAGHFFSFQLPGSVANGQTHVLYAYGALAKPQHQLYPGAMSYVAYTPKAEAVFNQQLSGFVQSSCTSCHTWNYTYLFSGPLMNPTPAAGGTATNNMFFRKMSGLTGHSGGQFCPNGQNAGICAEIQRWWNAEFN